jgi:hypothetical protein
VRVFALFKAWEHTVETGEPVGIGVLKQVSGSKVLAGVARCFSLSARHAGRAPSPAAILTGPHRRRGSQQPMNVRCLSRRHSGTAGRRSAVSVLTSSSRSRGRLTGVVVDRDGVRELLLNFDGGRARPSFF